MKYYIRDLMESIKADMLMTLTHKKLENKVFGKIQTFDNMQNLWGNLSEMITPVLPKNTVYAHLLCF